MYSYAERYADMIEGVMATFKPQAEKFRGPVLDQVQRELGARVPLDTLQERRQWRDKRLAALAQLVNRIDAEEK